MGAQPESKTISQSDTGIYIAGKQIFRGFRDFRGINQAFILWELVLYDYVVI